MPTIYERVRDVARQFRIAEDLDAADPMDVVALIIALEGEFSTVESPLEISDEDAGRIHTTQDAVTYLKKHGVRDTEKDPSWIRFLGFSYPPTYSWGTLAGYPFYLRRPGFFEKNEIEYRHCGVC